MEFSVIDVIDFGAIYLLPVNNVPTECVILDGGGFGFPHYKDGFISYYARNAKNGVDSSQSASIMWFKKNATKVENPAPIPEPVKPRKVRLSSFGSTDYAHSWASNFGQVFINVPVPADPRVVVNPQPQPN